VTPAIVKGALCGLGAAALFGASAPVSKRLLAEVSPLLLSGLLYLGAAVGVALVRAFERATAVLRGDATSSREAALRRHDAPALLVIVLVGGLASPLLMLAGLGRVSGVAGSLLLNLEAPFTMLIAVAAFREHMGRRTLAAAALIVGAAAWLGLRGSAGEAPSQVTGVLALAGACAGWGLDNNLSQRLSLRDPSAVVLIKTGGAGGLAVALAVTLGLPWPSAQATAAALVLGAASYGASLLLDMYALRSLGAAREAAFFATAPFMGAALAVPILGERPGAGELLAGALMIGGVVLLLRERHSHPHTHEALEHEHLHVHDEHHQHVHEAGDAPGEPHAHRHRHAPVTHEHPHVPDAHHRHRH
jgi:drug/metabolite transporter (DMT)-like permease